MAVCVAGRAVPGQAHLLLEHGAVGLAQEEALALKVGPELRAGGEDGTSQSVDARHAGTRQSRTQPACAAG
jgi:hypothetical protein